MAIKVRKWKMNVEKLDEKTTKINNEFSGGKDS